MSEPLPGPSTQRRGTTWVVSLAIGVAVALVASLATAAVAGQQRDERIAPVEVARTAAFDIPPTGLVVALSRPGFVDLPARIGVDNAFIVSVTAAEPVAAIDLVAGAEVVARVVPTDDRSSRIERLTWQPADAGPMTVLARAYDRLGHVGMSNPIRLDVEGTVPVTGFVSVTTAEGDTVAAVAARLGVTPETVIDANDLGALPVDAPLSPGTVLEIPVPGPVGPVDGADGSVQGARATSATPFGSIPPLPDSLELAPPPSLTARVADCTATVDAMPGEQGQRLVLLQLPPTGGAFAPVAAIESETELPVVSGSYDFVLAATVAGSLVSWSDPVRVPVGDGCSGWEGAARLDGGILRVAGDAEVDRAYLYVSTTPSAWVRVPSDGFVVRGPDGFDFAGLLPPVAGSSLSIEAWGRSGESLRFLGRGSFDPPAPPPGGDLTAGGGSLVAIPDAMPFPKAQLWWLRPPDWKHGGDPPAAVTSGDVAEPSTLEFQWAAPIPGVTHGLVQVTTAPVPSLAGPAPGGVLYQRVVAGNGGTFSIDFETVVDAFEAEQNGTVAHVGSLADQTYQVLAGLAGGTGGTTTTSPQASPHPLDLDPTDDFDVQEALAQLFVVRVVPMVADTWTGLVTNDVSLHVDPSGLFPVAPAGERPYALDVELVQPPRPPDPAKMSCWQFAGWSDDAALAQHLADEQKAADASFAGVNLGTYTVWKALVASVGSGPICAGCYHIGSTTVSVAGVDCSDSGFIGDVFEAFETFVNMLSSAFAFIKAQIVDLAVSLSGCKAIGDTAASVCSTLATVALDAALASFGIPPSLPNWDQLVAAAKGDIVEFGVGLATQLGVPCDDADFAAEIHGKKELTCEAVLGELLDQVEDQVDQLYADTAASMGFDFPDLMIVRPHPSGQVGPASVEITVEPTEYTAAEGGHTCGVGVYSKAAWAGAIDPLATATMGSQVGSPIVSGLVPGLFPGSMGGPVKIPQLFWAGTPFEANFWDLPDLAPQAGAPHGYQPASRTYQVYPPAGADPVQVSELYSYQQPGVTNAQGQPVVGVTQLWHTWPRQVFLLNEGAHFSLLVTSGCASGTGLRTWDLPGFGPGPATEVGG